jgi:integrase
MLSFGRRRDDDTHVFSAEDGTSYHPQQFIHMLHAKAKPQDCQRSAFTTYRHGHIAVGILAGVPLMMMSERAGHSSAQVTGDIYGHITPAADRDAAEVSAKAVRGYERTTPTSWLTGVATIPDRTRPQRKRSHSTFALCRAG